MHLLNHFALILQMNGHGGDIDQFHMVLRLSKDKEEWQVSTLLYCLGEEAAMY